MRVSAVAIIFVILLLLGFLPTPGVSKFIIPDYYLARFEYSEPLRQLQNDIAAAERQALALDTKISRLVADATQTPDAGQKSKLAAEATLLTRDKVVLDEQKAKFEKVQSDIQKKLELAAADATNLSLVIRALALGAIGALLSIFAKSLTPGAPGPVPDRRSASRRAAASMAMGALIAIVAVGLFYTGFVSIFSGAEKSTGTPDFWKVTLLSLFAGAFADRLFQAASYKMERYAGQIERAEAPAGPITEPVAQPRKSRMRKPRTAAADNVQPKRSPPSLVTVPQSADAAAVNSDRGSKA